MIQGILYRKEQGIEATAEEKTKIINYVIETTIGISDGTVQTDEDIQKLFPQEWAEAQDRIDKSFNPN